MRDAESFLEIEDIDVPEPPSNLLDRLLSMDAVDPGTTNQTVNAGMSRLPSELRELLRMAYIQDFSAEDLAEHYGVPEGTITGRLSHALSLLIAEVVPRAEPSFSRADIQTLLETVGSTNTYVFELLVVLVEGQGRILDVEKVLAQLARRFPRKDRVYLLDKISHARAFLNERFPGLLRVQRDHRPDKVHGMGVDVHVLSNFLPARPEDALPRLTAYEDQAAALIASGAGLRNDVYRMRPNPTLVRFMGLLLLEEGQWVHRGRLYPAFAERLGHGGITNAVYHAIQHCRQVLHENFPALLEETFEADSDLRIPVRLRMQPERFDFYWQHGDRLARQMLESTPVGTPIPASTSTPELHALLAMLIRMNGRWMEREAFPGDEAALHHLKDRFPNLIQSGRCGHATPSPLRFHPNRFRAYLKEANFPSPSRPWEADSPLLEPVAEKLAVEYPTSAPAP